MSRSDETYYLPNHFKRWLIGCLLFLLPACKSSPANPATASPVDPQKARDFLRQALLTVRTGDMITRTGNDFTSFCLRQLCLTDKTYSHCGIVSIEQDTVFVYHALGGEFNPDQELLREPLDIFVSPEANRGFGLFRFNMDQEGIRSLIKACRQAYDDRIPFDMKFDLETDDRMYCSEFAAKMYRKAYGSDTMFSPTQTPALRYLAPDNLFTHPACRSLFRAVY